MSEPGSDAVYRAPVAAGSAELREKGSRFLGIVLPVVNEEEAQDRLDHLRTEHDGATHLCWAWRIGWPPLARSSDAGEPAGTAGRPILGVLESREISDAVAAVARWFGGVKLGRGGLARAYRAAAAAALAVAPTVERSPSDELALELPYAALGAVERLVHPPQVVLAEQRFGATVRLVLRVARSRRAALEERLRDLRIEVGSWNSRESDDAS